MTALDAAIQIRSLRAQLDVLEAKLRTVPLPQRHTLADLRGVVSARSLTTDQEIDAAKYHGFDEAQR